MYPGEKLNNILSKPLREIHQCDCLSSDSETTTEENDNEGINQGHIYEEMVHITLRIIKKITKNPCHSSSWQGIDQEHISQIIPNILYLFFFDRDSLNDGIKEDNNTIQRVWSMLQEISYRKVLLDIVYAVKHTIYVDTVRRIDSSMGAKHFPDCGKMVISIRLV